MNAEMYSSLLIFFLIFDQFPLQIDTLAGEYPAVTNYLYVTYNGQVSAVTYHFIAIAYYDIFSPISIC